MNRPLALVTGASSGIGRALAVEFAKGGHDLALAARSEDSLRNTAAACEAHGAAARIIVCDLATAEGVGSLTGALAGEEIDVLVNNAGFGDMGPFADAEAARSLGMIDLNIRALTDLTRRFLPAMLERGRGGVLNVASTAAFQPGPNMAVYCASKAYVLSFSEALWKEAQDSGVTITALCPGPTRSGFQSAAGMEGARLFEAAPVQTSEEVARYGYAAFAKGRRVAVSGFFNKIIAASAGFVPRGMLLSMGSSLLKKD